jgi:hypothetical protein
MPKLTDTDQRSVDTMEEDIDDASSSLEDAAVRRLCAKLEGPFTVHARIKNNRVDYSFEGRPDPTLSGVTDAVLMTAIIKAGRTFSFSRLGKKARKARYGHHDTGSPSKDKPKLAFKDHIRFDFEDGIIQSTLKKDTTLQVLSIVVQNLAASAAKDAPPPAPAN